MLIVIKKMNKVNEEMESLEIERELLLRQSKLLFPEVENWLLEIAVDAYLKNGGEKVAINEEEASQVKSSFFQDLEYKTPTKV